MLHIYDIKYRREAKESVKAGKNKIIVNLLRVFDVVYIDSFKRCTRSMGATKSMWLSCHI